MRHWGHFLHVCLPCYREPRASRHIWTFNHVLFKEKEGLLWKKYELMPIKFKIWKHYHYFLIMNEDMLVAFDIKIFIQLFN